MMAMTRHRSVASVIGCFQAGAVEDNPAARFAEVVISPDLGKV
ncbi:hypothetical protein [Xanthomonas theicola]|nr:hypothetical protein [Xanthomonas theicola]